MILLQSTDALRVITSGTPPVDVHASFADLVAATGAVTPGRTNTAISAAATTPVVAAPSAGSFRTVKTLTARNRHASAALDVTIVHYDGAITAELVKVTLSAGDALHYDEHAGFSVRDALGRVKSRSDATALPVGALQAVVLAADVTNANAVANTIADVTGLSFPAVAGESYWFRFVIRYTAAAATTGSRWSINGPANPTALSYESDYTLTATARTVNTGLAAYDLPAASNASSIAASNLATIEGFITPASGGNVTARFASEILSSAIIAKAGSLVQWMRVA